MKRKLNRCILSLMLLVLTVFNSGCWSSREVEDLAIVTLFGIDRITENGVDKWQISSTIMNPGGGVQEGGMNGGNGKGGAQELLFKGTGITLQEAIGNFVDGLARSPFYSHISAVIIGERAAKEDMSSTINNLLRYWENRPHLYIIATRGEAYRVLQARPAISKMLSKEIEMMTEKTSKKLGKSADVTLKRLSADLLSPDRDAVLPQIKLVLPKEEKDTEEGETKQSVLLEGLAVFRGDKLTGWLNADETRGYLFIAEKLSATHIYLPVQLNGQWFSYTIGMSKSKVKPELSGDQLRIRVSIETQGSIMESGNSNMTPEDIDQMEIAAAEAIQELAFKAIDKAKEYDADFLGLMQKLHRSDLTAWEKIKPDWREYFQNADIEVEVKASITNAGQIGAKPQISK